MLRQILAVTRLNLANLPARLGSSAIIVVGVGGVVAVLLGLLAMSTGFRSALAETARPDRALILRTGSTSEMNSWVGEQERAIVAQYPGLAVASGETYTTLSLPRHGSDGGSAHAGIRGVTAAAFRLRPEVELVAGRRFEPGTNEIMVGVRAAAEYPGLAVGSQVAARGTSLQVVGHFAAAGSAVESELWLDLPMAQDVFRRQGGVCVVRVRLAADADPEAINERLEADPRLSLSLIPETRFFAAQSASRAALIDTFAYFVAGIMALGSVAAALNTMYAAVSRRRLEIATLRALGFGAPGVVVSVLIEAMLLALAGGLLGAGVVYLAFNGQASSTFNGTSGSQLAFAFRLTPELVATGLAWALLLGLIGGLLPALRAARTPVAQALRV
jgi:putative ABC transport system permease protein